MGDQSAHDIPPMRGRMEVPRRNVVEIEQVLRGLVLVELCQ